MFRNIKQYNAQAVEGAGADTLEADKGKAAEAVAAPFDKWSENIENLFAPEPKAEEKKPEDKKPAEVVVEEKKPEAIVPDPKKADEPVLQVPEIKLPEITKEDVPATFVEMAKEIGFEIEKEDYDQFITKSKDHIKTEIENGIKAFTEKIATDKDLLLKTVGSQVAVDVIDIIRADGSIYDIIGPLRQIDSYMQMEDADLVALNLSNEKNARGQAKYTQEEVTAMLEELKPHELKNAAEALRESLDEHANSILASEAEKKRIYLQQQQELNQNAGKVQLVAEPDFIKAVSTLDEFMGAKLSKSHKDYLIDAYTKGELATDLQDPKSLAEFKLFKALGPQILKSLQEYHYGEGLKKSKEGLYKVPPATPVAGQAVKAGDNEPFSSWTLD